MSAESATGVYPIMQRKGIFVHAFLLDDGRELTLIDTLHGSDARLILDLLKRLGRPATDIKQIVLTHAHRAHLGGLAVLAAASGAPVYCHDWEADIVEGDRGIQCTTLRPMRPLRIWPFQVAARFSRITPSRVKKAVRGGDRIGPLQVMDAPGHTPGHLAFFWPERRALFAGDALVSYPEFGYGWPCFMLNARQNRESLRQLAGLDIDYLGVGHGGPITTGGGERLRSLIRS